MQTGSLIFKSTKYRHWYSERLWAWKDYIPVDYNTTDLEKKLKWANEKDPEMIVKIIQHGKGMVQHHVRPEDSQCYAYRMVLEYTTLFDEHTMLPVGSNGFWASLKTRLWSEQ